MLLVNPLRLLEDTLLSLDRAKIIVVRKGLDYEAVIESSHGELLALGAGGTLHGAVTQLANATLDMEADGKEED
jgi:hypothetical protein